MGFKDNKTACLELPEIYKKMQLFGLGTKFLKGLILLAKEKGHGNP
jgi:hypothetical protein